MMAARRYKISLRGLKNNYFTSERSEQVKYYFKPREISYLQVAM